MSRQGHLVSVAALCAGLACSAAQAGGAVYDGISLDQLQTVLNAGFSVQAETAPSGAKFLWVKGRDSVIVAHVTHCGDKPQCEGVRYFWIGDQSPAAAFINQFNRDEDYSKLTVNSKGHAVLSLEIFTVGGVTADNLAHNAAMLMLRMDHFAEAIGKQAKGGAPSSKEAKLRDVVGAMGFGPRSAKPQTARPTDAAQVKLFTDEVETSE